MLETAIKAARLAGEKIEYYFETVFEHEEKEDRSVVTKADLEAEEIILKKLEESFPDHNVISEERGDLGKKSDYVWVIDPLDGTLNFSRGLPIFAVSIALLHKGEGLLSVVYNPVTKSLFHAEKGKGTFWNEEKVSVSQKSDFDSTIVTLGRARDSENKEKTLAIINKLYFKNHQRVIGSSAIELAWVACGRVEGFIGVGLKNWDVAGGLLMVSEAGGSVTDLSGQPLIDRDKLYFVASNGKIHKQLLDTINS